MAAGFALDEKQLLVQFPLDPVNLLEMERDAVAKELLDQGPLAVNRPALLENEQRKKEVSNQQYRDETIGGDPVCKGAHNFLRTPWLGHGLA